MPLKDSPPFMQQLTGPTVSAVTVAVVTAAATTIHWSGRLGRSRGLLIAEIGAVLGTATFCAWRLWRTRSLSAADTRQSGPANGQKANPGPSKADGGCCGGACGVSCDGQDDDVPADHENQEEGGDLEDLQSSGDEAKAAARAAARATYVQPKAARRRATRRLHEASDKGHVEESAEMDFTEAHETFAHQDRATSEDVFLPGLAKIYFKTFGCSHNVSDSEYMRKPMRLARSPSLLAN